MRWTRLMHLVLVSGCAMAQADPDPGTLEGKVLLGYQGWFRCPGGGAMGTNWRHWANGVPSAATLTVDMYPDLREFEAGELCAVPGMTLGGNPAQLFSSGNSQTVDRHFRWMKQYGLDGVLVQRFVTESANLRAAGDPVLKAVMAAARKYGRVFAIEYDISGANAATVQALLQADWQYLTGTLEVTSQPGYLRHNGKPVLGVWGIGLGDGRHPPNDPEAALRLVEWFRDTAGVAYIGGTPAYWRTLSNDAATDARWTAVYQAMDGIQPWTVGRYNSMAGVDRWRTERLQPDLAATGARQQVYMPVVFPGFSWANLNRTATQNQIPRNKGEFLWRQAYNAKAAGARMLKIAMFDEVDESTAMFKLARRRADAPDQGFWLTLDADGFVLPSDWYLRLAGEITRVFHEQRANEAALPADPGPPYGESPVVAAGGPVGAAGSIVSLYGERFRTDEALTVIDSTGMARVAQMLYASAGQLNVVLPEGVAAGAATLVAEREDGLLAYGRLKIEAVAPEIFAAAVVEGGAVVELYGTGIRGRSSLEAVACTIGGRSAPVLAAEAMADRTGVDRVRVEMPPGVTGVVKVRLVVDGVAANEIEVKF